ncbi:MAG: hypothetical protein B7X93_03060 [Hydrogenophilales bacterium 17-61-9]|nr:MAG: hypothetical protein B7X93_03060 [Hydrogenophilales bacterium 17-61-9]
MDNKTKDIRGYALRSPVARQYLFMVTALLANASYYFGWWLEGKNPLLPDDYLALWAASTIAISGYLFYRMSLGNSQVNLTPITPGLIWLAASALTMLVLLDHIDQVGLYAQAEIVKTTDSYGATLFALPVAAMKYITSAQILSLVLFSLSDIRAAFSAKPVIMDIPEPEPEKESKPVPTSSAHASPLATRDTEALQPKLIFSDLAGNEELKKKLSDAAAEWMSTSKRGTTKQERLRAPKQETKNGIFLHGVPGTGKTVFAEALAGELGLKLMKVNVGSMASRFINQTTEQLQDIIDSALRQAPCVLFLDEVEAIFPDRSRIERGDSEESKVVASFLSSVEKLRAGRVLLIAATNYKDRVDAAAIREGRFDFHIEVAVPDFEARKGLIQNVLTKAGKTVEPAVMDRLATRWGGFNVARIQEAARRAAGFATANTVGMVEFMRGLRDVQGNKTGVPEGALGLADLYFDDELKVRLANLATTFARSDEIEARGGSVPKGVVFYGPPGTGKTTMAQALAKESGWAFIATSGKEILSDSNKLAEIRRKASDLRPAIVFIDEADDILGDRRMSGMKMHTNDLLRTIDGAGEPLHDVVWMLATNDIDGLDEAVIRRFPTKIELPVPGLATTAKMVHDWASKRTEMIAGGVDDWSNDVAAALEGLAPSVVKNILDAALNTEAADSVIRNEGMSITVEEVLAARREMRA